MGVFPAGSGAWLHLREPLQNLNRRAMMRLALVTSLLFLVLASACARQNAQPPAESKHSTASLVLEDTAVPPSGQTRIGIRFKMDPEWHIYWQNPGDSGEPPKITWKLPPGVQMGALEWP